MATFILVHGAYHGGWCWRDVVPVLRSQGHQVFHPSLTGMGDRSHLSNPETSLDTHIDDIGNLILFEDLQDVILVGHSYAGVVIGGVADRLPERSRGLAFVDALIPRDGFSVLDFQTPERADYLRARAAENDGWRLPPISAEFYGVEDSADAAWVNDKCVGQPLATFTQVQNVTGDWEKVLNKIYIRCTQSGLDYMDQFSEQALADENWTVHYLPTGHDCMVTAPHQLAALLMTIV